MQKTAVLGIFRVFLAKIVKHFAKIVKHFAKIVKHFAFLCDFVRFYAILIEFYVIMMILCHKCCDFDVFPSNLHHIRPYLQILSQNVQNA